MIDFGLDFGMINNTGGTSLGWLCLIAVIGACVGSFINVVAYRLPNIMMREWDKDVTDFIKALPDNHPKRTDAHIASAKHTIFYLISEDSQPSISLSHPRSHCPICRQPIIWRDNIPIVSYLLLQGKCRHCHTLIPPGYPAIEIITAVLSCLVLLVFGLSVACALALIFSWLLIALSVIDLRVKLLPDRLVAPLVLLGLTANSFGIFTTPKSAMLGAVAGFMSLWLTATVFKSITGKDGMGLGDAKLLAALGAWLGLSALPIVVFIAAVLGVLAGLFLRLKTGQSAAFAFGPYLAMAGLVMLLTGDALWVWYLGLF